MAVIHKLYTERRGWAFVMLSTDAIREVTRLIHREAPKPATTMRVFLLVCAYVDIDTARVTASREEIATDADTTPQEVSRALAWLARQGVMAKRQHQHRDVWYVNAEVAWRGSLAAREAVASPRLELVR
jgi:hypothetical protein